MAVNKLKKINVRSPYYISVSKSQEVTEDVTEPVTEELKISCGDTTQVGVSVGTKKYKISVEGRQFGNYTITFANIKTPIKYRIGYSDNMPSFSTAGTDNYASEWEAATGETPTLTDYGANQNGVAATATYTSTQSDVDTYGNEIILEVFQPLITQDYSFSLSCPDLVADEVPADDGFVIVVSFKNNTGTSASTANRMKINGQVMGSLPVGAIPNIDRYVMSDQTPNLLPEKGNFPQYNQYGAGFFNVNQFGWQDHKFIDESGGHNISAIYKPEDILSTGINNLLVENTGYAVSTAAMTVMISRHPVKEVNGVKYIRGSGDGVKVKAISVSFRLFEQESMEFQFRGSNSTDLEGISAVRNTAYIQAADEDQIPVIIETFVINPV